MPVLGTGMFLMIAVGGIASMMYALNISLTFAPIMRVLAIVLLFAAGLYLVSGYEVSMDRSYTDPNGMNITDSYILIEENSEGFWLGYIFIALAFLNMFLMYTDFFRGGADG